MNDSWGALSNAQEIVAWIVGGFIAWKAGLYLAERLLLLGKKLLLRGAGVQVTPGQAQKEYYN